MTRRPGRNQRAKRPRVRWSALSPHVRWGNRLAIGAILGAVSVLVGVFVFNSWAFSAGGSVLKWWLAARNGFAVGITLAVSLGLFSLCQLAGSVLALDGRARLLRRLRTERFTLCPGCGYSLRQIPRAPRCPECARAFDPRGVVREWGRILPRRGRRWELRLRTSRYSELRR